MNNVRSRGIRLTYSCSVDSRIKWVTKELSHLKSDTKTNTNNDNELLCIRLLRKELDKAYNILREIGMAGKENTYLEKLLKYDKFTALHCMDVALIAKCIAEEIGISTRDVRECLVGGVLHDIGKTKIDKRILLKKGSLTDSEREIMNEHAILGYNMVEELNIPKSCKRVVIEHHERLDGTGYPNRLHYIDIGPISQIVMVADVFDALATKRSYKRAYGVDGAIRIIDEDRNKYNSEVVAALKSVCN